MVPVRVKRASLVRATGDTPRTAFQRLGARLCGDSVMELVKLSNALSIRAGTLNPQSPKTPMFCEAGWQTLPI